MSWKISKQEIVVDSTINVKYIVACMESKKAIWIKNFTTELGVVLSIADPVELYCDNNGAIMQAKEPRSHQRSKHILRRFHLIRDIVKKDVKMCKILIDNNVVDPLTKHMTQQKHDRHTKSISIRYMGDWL